MKLIRGLSNLHHHHFKSVVTIGNFDGLHLGHKEVIKVCCAQARVLSLPAVLVTFEPQPQEFFRGDAAAPRLMRFREKWEALLSTDIDYVMVLKFNRQLAAMSAQDFVQQILQAGLGMQAIIVGNDFRFGAKRTGDFALLQQLAARDGFVAQQLAPYQLAAERISSTRVRAALEQGNMDLAAQLLGRDYCMSGRVIHGDKRGRDLGYPTVNIAIWQKPRPLSGIFAVKVYGVGNAPLIGAASLGMRPTFHGTKPLLEVYLLDFSGDLYGQHLQVEFIKKLRDELHFTSVESLVKQIQQDVEQVRTHFANSFLG